jgi:RNA polymerase sigma factor (sigma-70 family)
VNQSEPNAGFDELVRRNRGRLVAIARSYAGGDTEDLLQEILLQVWKGLPAFRGESGLDTWCYRVALNTALSWFRRTKRRQRGLPGEPAEVEQIGGPAASSDEVALLQQFVKTLGPVDRAVILMVLEDMAGDEIARNTGLSPGAVRVRLHRIRQKLASWDRGDS